MSNSSVSDQANNLDQAVVASQQAQPLTPQNVRGSVMLFSTTPRLKLDGTVPTPALAEAGSGAKFLRPVLRLFSAMQLLKGGNPWLT